MVSIASGAMALRQVVQIQGNLDQIVNDSNLKIRLTNEMSEAVHVVSRVAPKLVLLNDPAHIETEVLKITGARRRYDDAWSALLKLPTLDASRSLRSGIQSAADCGSCRTEHECVLGQHEPRNPDADVGRARHRRTAQPHNARPHAAQIRWDDSALGRLVDDPAE